VRLAEELPSDEAIAIVKELQGVLWQVDEHGDDIEWDWGTINIVGQILERHGLAPEMSMPRDLSKEQKNFLGAKGIVGRVQRRLWATASRDNKPIWMPETDWDLDTLDTVAAVVPKPKLKTPAGGAMALAAVGDASELKPLLMPIALGVVGLAAAAGLAYAFWPKHAPASVKSKKPVADMTPAERLQQHEVGQEVMVVDRQFVIQSDGDIAPSPIYQTVAYAGKALILEQDNAINLLGAPPSLNTNAGRVAAGLAGMTVAIATRGTTGELMLSTKGWALPAIGPVPAIPQPGAAPVYPAGTWIEEDDEPSRATHGKYDSVKDWYRIHILGKGANDAYSWHWVPRNYVAWDPPGTRMFVNSDGSLSKVLGKGGKAIPLPGGGTATQAAPAAPAPAAPGAPAPAAPAAPKPSTAQQVMSGVSTGVGVAKEVSTITSALSGLTGAAGTAGDVLGGLGSAAGAVGDAGSALSGLAGAF